MHTRNLFSVVLVSGALAMTGAFASCDRAAVETTKVTETPSGTKVEKTSVVEHNDGSISKESESKTIRTNP